MWDIPGEGYRRGRGMRVILWIHLTKHFGLNPNIFFYIITFFYHLFFSYIFLFLFFSFFLNMKLRIQM
uniref:Uncharacterized protein n=1 Tax=Lutzomyia longipalpis TaxID=7200 RepID=A0A7G3B4U5_LUTLO